MTDWGTDWRPEAHPSPGDSIRINPAGGLHLELPSFSEDAVHVCTHVSGGMLMVACSPKRLIRYALDWQSERPSAPAWKTLEAPTCLACLGAVQ